MDNTVTLVGNLTRDPELRISQNGLSIAKFGLAVNRRTKVQDDWEDSTSFFEVDAFGSLADNLVVSVERGTRVIVTGRLEWRSWEAPDGTKRQAVNISADSIGPDLRWAEAVVTRNVKNQ